MHPRWPWNGPHCPQWVNPVIQLESHLVGLGALTLLVTLLQYVCHWNPCQCSTVHPKWETQWLMVSPRWVKKKNSRLSTSWMITLNFQGSWQRSFSLAGQRCNPRCILSSNLAGWRAQANQPMEAMPENTNQHSTQPSGLSGGAGWRRKYEDASKVGGKNALCSPPHTVLPTSKHFPVSAEKECTGPFTFLSSLNGYFCALTLARSRHRIRMD